MMDINKTLIVNDADIIEMSYDVLRRFHAKWKDVFEQTGINKFDDFNSIIEDNRVQVFLAGDHQIYVNALATKTSPFYEDLHYIILAWVPVDLVKLFNTDDFNISDIREKFYSMAQNLGGYPCENKNRAECNFSFDKYGTLVKVGVIFQNHNDPALSDENYQHSSEHDIYDRNDSIFLKKNGLDKVHQQDLRDFNFLWEHTHIKEILLTDDFLASFKLYAQDVTRYNSLIAMTKI